MNMNRPFLSIIISVCIAMAIGGSSSAQDSGSLAELRKVRESFVQATLASYSPSDDVTENFLACSEHGRAAIDVLLMQLYLSVQLPEDEVRRVMGLFDRETGRWRDIDYTDMSRGGWDMTLHVTRIYALAKSYKWEGSPFYKSPELGGIIHRAAGWWFDNMPVNPNWWHNDIGVPKKFAAAMILMRDELSEREMQGILAVLDRSGFGMTGQNKAWLAGIQLMKALLVEDPALASEARRQIAEEIYVTEDEGIQKDWSFHQHGPQMQMGNYGLAFAEGVSFWARVLDGTAYAFEEKQVDILENFILDGLCWTIWKGTMDPSACGRQLHIGGGAGKAYACVVAMSNMAALGRADSGMFRSLVSCNLEPEKYHNTLIGARYYPYSDFGVYRTKDWYASVRMQSERTIGYEFTNAENQLAQFSADGALLVMRSGKEYRDIFPYWDWRMVPGVTAYYDGGPLRTDDDRSDKQNNSRHVGGMTTDSGMVTTMEVDRHGLHAFKSNFFFPDIIISLGSDIRSSRPEISRITTAIDQNHFAGTPESGSFKSRTDVRTGWVWHSGAGYVALDGAEMHVETPVQSGNWSEMAPMYDRVDSGRVFKCYLEHSAGGLGTYAYAVLPDTDAAGTRTFASRYSSGKDSGEKIPEVLRNDDHCQAIRYGGRLYIVIHKAGSYSFGSWSHLFSAPGIHVFDGRELTSQKLPQANIAEDVNFDFSSMNTSHPRLILGRGEEKQLAEAIASVPQLKTVYDYILGECGTIIGLPLPERVMTGKRLLSVSKDAFRRMLYLSYAYRMTGDMRYADAAKAVAMQVCGFSDWNPSHFLDTSEMSLGLSFAYDWLYDTLSEQERKTISEAVYEKLIVASELPKVTFRYVSNNWNSVCNAGIVAACAAFYEDWPEEASRQIRRSITSGRLAMDTYFPDGCYPEGYGYWVYGSEFQMIMNEVLNSVFGSDAGLGASRGFHESARFMAYAQAPSGQCFNFSDGGPATSLKPSLFYFAQKCGEPSLAVLECEKLRSPDVRIVGRILPISLILAARHPETVRAAAECKGLPASCSFGGEMPLYIYRGGWHSHDDSYLAVKGGSSSSNHAHMDAGTFVYEYAGRRWAMDLGSQEYNSLEKRGLKIWTITQDSDRWKVFRYANQAHSTITLNDGLHRVLGYAPITDTYDSRGRHGAELDLTSVLGEDLVSSAVRRIWLDKNEFLHVEDRVACAKDSAGNAVPLEVKWIMNTPAEAEITSDGGIKLTQDGVSMIMRFKSDLPLRPFVISNDPPHDYDAPNSGCRVGFVSSVASARPVVFKVTLYAM